MTVDELKDYFNGKSLPTGPLKVNRFETIVDPSFFVEAELRILRANPGNKSHDSCRLRLMEFKEWLEAHPDFS